MYGIRYLKAFNYISMSQCATRLSRESKVDPRQPRKGEKRPAHLLLLYNHCLVVFHL